MVIILADDGVVKSRLLGVVDCFVDLLLVSADTFDEGRLIILKLNFVKWIGAMGCVEWLKKRILARFRLWLVFLDCSFLFFFYI